ncbi:hypothetical protein [Mariprofundus ferrooxydans]|uniref:hypothetical protein n=1 Tax=Mariprofundus ferrooxydans TaxID=314344 RepID=UPI00036F5670|nr:hypothetical protein [Mariprofundus ferrooxydans]
MMMTIEDELSCEMMRSDIDEMCEAFRAAMLNLGFADGAIALAAFDQCRIEMSNDVYDHETCITGRWLHADGSQFAHLVRYANGNMFAEHDVLLPHPQKPDMFVEALEVWGTAGKLKSEARLLPAL